jgi:hypothetical protein
MINNMRIKRLIRNINMLNAALLTGALFFAFYIFFPSFDITAGFSLPAVKTSVAEKEETGTEIRIPSITEYMKITEENLFHPERKIPVEKKADQQQPLTKPEFVLYGILITDDLRLGYIEDLKAPRNSPGRGKRQTALKKGDVLSGFTVKEIETDRIVMIRGEEKIVVLVNDPSRTKERKETGVTTASATATAATQKPPKQLPVAAQIEQRKQKARNTPQPSSSRSHGQRPKSGN